MTEYYKIENSEDNAFITILRTQATTHLSSTVGAAVNLDFYRKSENQVTGVVVKEKFSITIRKNEWTELKRLINESLRGR